MSQATHYACALPPEAHERRRRVGRGHRSGCAVTPGHTPGTPAGSRSGCRECKREINRRSFRKHALMARHGMTVEEYDLLFEEQGGRCFICGRRQEELRLAVDHNHVTGVRRKLLCKSCNLGLGDFRENPEALRRAADYLEGRLT